MSTKPVVTLPDELMKKCEDWAEALYERAVSSKDGYTEEGGCREFHNPALERLSCDHEDRIAYRVEGLRWSLGFLRHLLDAHRSSDMSMAIGTGRALEYAINVLEEQLAKAAADEARH